jgi:hypothetical protein
MHVKACVCSMDSYRQLGENLSIRVRDQKVKTFDSILNGTLYTAWFAGSVLVAVIEVKLVHCQPHIYHVPV